MSLHCLCYLGEDNQQHASLPYFVLGAMKRWEDGGARLGGEMGVQLEHMAVAGPRGRIPEVINRQWPGPFLSSLSSLQVLLSFSGSRA